MPLHLESSTLTECGPHRTASRCVSWNASGQYVAFGTSDRLVRLCTVESGGTAREVLVVTGHQAAVTQVKFHPVDKTLVSVFVCVLSAAILWVASALPFTHSLNSLIHSLIRFLSSCLPSFMD
jgi:WD40 repeat protein